MNAGQFVRRPSAGNPDIIVSKCVRCGAIVAASPSQVKLQIAERQHHCGWPDAPAPSRRDQGGATSN